MILDEKSSSSSERPKSVITLERVTNEEDDEEVKEKVIETKLTNFKETWMFSPKKKDKDSSEESLSMIIFKSVSNLECPKITNSLKLMIYHHPYEHNMW